MVFTCAASLPAPVIKILARYEDDPASLRAAGIEYACRPAGRTSPPTASTACTCTP